MDHHRQGLLLVTLCARGLIAAALALVTCTASAQVATCAVAYTGSNVNFGVYDPFNSNPVTASMSATLTCTHVSGGAARTNWTMALSSGNSGNCATRHMNSGGNTLSYNIYRGSLAGGVWGATCAGDPSGQIQTTNGNPVASATNILYGQLPTGQFNAGVGSYSDTLVLTVTYN